MRSLMFLLFLVLFCSMQTTSSATSAIGAAQRRCCGEFSKGMVPLKKIVSYDWTSSDCPRRSVVFQTIAGKEICADPKASWVNGHIEAVDNRTTAKTTTAITSKTV